MQGNQRYLANWENTPERKELNDPDKSLIEDFTSIKTESVEILKA